MKETTMQPTPMPVNAGCMSCHAVNATLRNLWPIPSSRKNNGIPSITIKIKKGTRNAPVYKKNQSFSLQIYDDGLATFHFMNTKFETSHSKRLILKCELPY